MSLYSFDGGYPSPLPHRIKLPNGLTRTDPNTFTTQEIAAAGFVLAPSQPLYDSDTEQLAWDGSDWAVEPRTIKYKNIKRIDFFRLLQSEAGLTHTNLVASKGNANLAAFWILLEITEEIHRDAPEIAPALTALETLEYIDVGGAAATLAAWPKT